MEQSSYNEVHQSAQVWLFDASRKMVIVHGVPVTLGLDNGQPFDSEKLSEFCRGYGITQIKGIPYWPPPNGEVENYNQALFKALRITKSPKISTKL